MLKPFTLCCCRVYKFRDAWSPSYYHVFVDVTDWCYLSLSPRKIQASWRYHIYINYTYIELTIFSTTDRLGQPRVQGWWKPTHLSTNPTVFLQLFVWPGLIAAWQCKCHLDDGLAVLVKSNGWFNYIHFLLTYTKVYPNVLWLFLDLHYPIFTTESLPIKLGAWSTPALARLS